MKKASILFLFLVAASMIGWVPYASANPQNLTLQISDTNPAEGATISVTVTFCDDTAWAANRVRLLAVINQASLPSGAFSNCGTAGQVVAFSDQGILSGGTDGGSGYTPYSNDAGGGCPTTISTAIWDIPLNAVQFPGGAVYHVIVGAAEDYVSCNNPGGAVYVSQDITIQPPPPQMILSATSVAAEAAPNSLVRFGAGYSYVNTTGVQVSLPLPAGATLVETSAGGSLSGSTVTWTLPDTLGWISGEVWALVRVDGTTPDATVLTGDFSGSGAGISPSPTASASSTVRRPNLAITKTASSNSVAAGDSVSYDLAWTVDGQSLQWADAYDNNPSSTAEGFDGAVYTMIGGGTWNLVTGPDSGKILYADGNGGYPVLLRQSTLTLCDNYTVQGDLNIDSSNQPKTDAHLVVAHDGQNTTVANAYMVGISADAAVPGRYFIQRNSAGTPSYTAIAGGPVFAVNTWYTLKARVSTVAGSRQIEVKAWLRGTPEPAGWDSTYVDPSPLPCNPATNYIGWQADEHLDYYDNLMLYAPGPVANPVVTDNLPTGISFDGSSVSPTTGAPALSWAVAATVFGQPTALSWNGTACQDPVVNQASLSADGLVTVDSNIVTTNVTGSCGTPVDTSTPTFTPTMTMTFTPTPSFTPTVTLTPTFTGTPPPVPPTATPTITNTRPPTSTPTPSIHVWPIPYSPMKAVFGTLKAEVIPPGSSLNIYTVSGERVVKVMERNGRAEWNGFTQGGSLVAPGTYYYRIELDGGTLLKGVLVVPADGI